MTSQRVYRLVLWVSAIIGLAIMGDSLMYSLLPLAAPRLGIAFPLVGVLLSANRFVRLLSNTPVSILFPRLGPRLPFLLATGLALLAVVLYGLAAGFWIFLVARLLWGIAWSALRQGGYQMIWLGGAGQRGRLMGLQWGLIRLGSALSVLVGGILFDMYGYHMAVGVIALGVALAIPLAWRLPWPERAARPREVPSSGGAWQGLRMSASRWVIASGFAQSLLEGVTVSTAALFLSQRLSGGWSLGHLGTATGVLLAVRWLSNLLFAPSFGVIADRLGHVRTGGLLAAAVLALALLTYYAADVWAVVALGGMFIGNAGLVVVLAAAANTLALRTPSPHLLIGTFTTAVDAGLALGPLLAYAMVPTLSLAGMYVGISCLLLLSLLRLGRVCDPC